MTPTRHTSKDGGRPSTSHFVKVAGQLSGFFRDRYRYKALCVTLSSQLNLQASFADRPAAIWSFECIVPVAGDEHSGNGLTYLPIVPSLSLMPRSA